MLGRVVAACGLLVLSGSVPHESTSGRRDGLVVFAASDLQPAFTELGPAFEQLTGQPVVFSYGSSGSLAAQIELGAPADLFFSADESYVRSLAQRGILDRASTRVYAEGRLVLATLRSSGITVASLDQLLRPEVTRVAMANPEHAPYGRAARQALVSSGVWETMAPRVVMGENVRQAAQYLLTGAVEAALVSSSLALDTALVSAPLDPALHQPILQAAGIVRSSSRPSDAQRFLDFVTSDVGWPVMERFGFVRPHVR
ncbi:MAG: molybdate ABC transporter substrate-binding protein [Gemmatimonadota bacterium]|nr:molybdate ABC transporter substrate-binding protein [Gemmatimonadota bacterium]